MTMYSALARSGKALVAAIFWSGLFSILSEAQIPNRALPAISREKPPLLQGSSLYAEESLHQQEPAEHELDFKIPMGGFETLFVIESQESLAPWQDPGAVEAAPPEKSAGTTVQESEGFHWGAAIGESLLLTGLMHSARLTTQARTRAQLRGPFLKDYIHSVRGLRGWDDGDPFAVNYLGHPMEGAISGYIQIQNDPKGIRQEFGSQKSYWKSRAKAMGFAALFSTQYEIGPISDASIGNVGLKKSEKSKHSKGWVDLVITPTLGTAWIVGEDALDRHIVRRIEDRFSNRLIRAIVRSLLNPGRSTANVLRFKYPWRRDGRSL